MPKKKSSPPGLISTKKPDNPCPPGLPKTLDCLIAEGKIYCGKGKVWVEAEDGAGEKGKCMTINEYKQKKDARARRRSLEKKKKKFTSEPIPDYIMRALQPKKSVHPVYGNLRY